MSEENLTIEVVASWAGNPLASECLTERGLCVGPGASCWLMLPSELLDTDHDLIVRNEEGWWLRVPAGAELIGAEASEVGGVRRVALSQGATAEVKLGAFSFFVRASEPVETPALARPSLRWTRWLAVAAILHGIILGLFAMSPPDAAALNVEGLQDDTRYVSMSLDAYATPEPPPAPMSTGASSATADSSSAPAGEQGGPEGRTPSEASSPGARRPHGRFQPTFVPDASNLNQIGALAALAANPMSFSDGSSPYTAGNEHDGPGGLSNAALLAMPRGPSWGPFDMGDTGRGTCDPRRQDCTLGLIGVDGLHTDDHGPGGHQVALRRRNPDSGPPRIRTPQADTLGALSREQVRRTVRRHINEISFCYSQQLQMRPDLEGRVAVRFIVSPTGAVQSTAVASNTVGSAEVASCVERAVSRWTFPAAPGVTGVTYPFVMSPTN